jgi:hypothetical protein
MKKLYVYAVLVIAFLFLASAQASNSQSKVQAFTTTQSTEGVTEADWDQNFLNNLEAWFVESIRTRSKEKYASMGYDPKTYNPNIVASSVYMDIQRKKIIVTKINIDQSMRNVIVMGIKGNQLIRVNCIRSSNQDIPVWSGVCGDEVYRSLGIRITP